MEWRQISLIIVAVVLVFIWFVNRVNKHAKNMVRIGVTAAQVYVITGQEDAQVATKVINAETTKAYRRQLFSFVSIIPTKDEKNEVEACMKQRLKKLLEELTEEEEEVGVALTIKYKNRLYDMKSLWLNAILKCSVPLADEAAGESFLKTIRDKNKHLKR